MNLKQKNTAKTTCIVVLAAAAIAAGCTAAYFGIEKVRNIVDNAVGGTIVLENQWSVKAADLIDADAKKVAIDEKKGTYTVGNVTFDLLNHASTGSMDYEPIYYRFGLDAATVKTLTIVASSYDSSAPTFEVSNTGFKPTCFFQLGENKVAGYSTQGYADYVQADGTLAYANVLSQGASVDGLTVGGKFQFHLPRLAVLSDVHIFSLKAFGYSSEVKCKYIFDKCTASYDVLPDKLTLGKKDVLKYAEQWDDAHPAATASSSAVASAASSAA